MRLQSHLVLAPERRNQNRVGITFPEKENKTHEEHGPSTDINVIIQRLLRGDHVPLRDVQYGAEVDYDIDLVRAHQLRDETRQHLSHLPQDIIDKNGGLDAITDKFLSGRMDPADLAAEGAPEKPPVSKEPEAPRPQADQPSKPEAKADAKP